jgi:hypothetical protein
MINYSKSNTIALPDKTVIFNKIELPISEITITENQNLVKHHFPLLNKDYIESVGTASRRFSLKIPAYNSIFANIYPDLYNNLKIMMRSGVSSEFEYEGENIDVFVENLSDTSTPENTSGSTITMELVETGVIEKPAQLIRLDLQTYTEYSNKISKLLPIQKRNQFLKDTSLLSKITSLATKISTTLDKISLEQQKIINKYKNALQAYKRVSESLQTLISQNQTYISAFIRDIQQIGNIIIKSLNPINQIIKEKQIYITTSETNLYELSLLLANPIRQLISLNPTLNAKKLIPSNTKINYIGVKK